MNQLQEFFDSFTCKVCFQFYNANPFIICDNHHLLCIKCVTTMEAKSKREFTSTLKCPFCKDHKEFTAICENRQLLQIKGIVAKIKRQEENQNNQIAFLRRTYAKLQEQKTSLKENTCNVQTEKKYSKRLVCFCKNKYFSNPVEQIKSHIESISKLMKLMKRRQQNKMILPSIFLNHPAQPQVSPSGIKTEEEKPLSEKQDQQKIQCLEDILQELISESFKNAELMGQMLDAYRKRQINLKERQKWIAEQLEEKEAQIKMEAQYEILQYKLDYEQLVTNMKSNMEEVKAELKDQIQQLNREIKEKSDEISSLRKNYQLMEEKYKQTIDQLNSGVQQLQTSFQKFIKIGPLSPEFTDKFAPNPQKGQALNHYSSTKYIKIRAIGMQPDLMPINSRLNTPNFTKERNNSPHQTGNSQTRRVTELIMLQKIKRENILLKK